MVPRTIRPLDIVRFLFIIDWRSYMKRGKVYIIPNEDQIIEDCFYREIGSSHLRAIQEFSDKYRLGYQFHEEDYQNAPCQVAMDGHLIIKTEEDASLAVAYIPEEITDRQSLWLYDHQRQLSKYGMIVGYELSKEESNYKLFHLHGLDEIMKSTNKKNFIYHKRKEQNYVGKKI